MFISKLHKRINNTALDFKHMLVSQLFYTLTLELWFRLQKEDLLNSTIHASTTPFCLVWVYRIAWHEYTTGADSVLDLRGLPGWILIFAVVTHSDCAVFRFTSMP